jgi:hypothetical protein
MRLPFKEMEQTGLDDAYGMNREQQEKLFAKILKRAPDISADGFIRSRN